MFLRFFVIAGLFISTLMSLTYSAHAQNFKSLNPYEVLGLRTGATKDEVQAAWRTLIKRYHPDQNPDSPQDAQTKTIQINQARDAILNNKKPAQSKYAYDTYPTENARSGFEKKTSFDPNEAANSFFSTIKSRGLYDRLPNGPLKDYVFDQNQATSPKWTKSRFNISEVSKYLKDHYFIKDIQALRQVALNFMIQIFGLEKESFLNHSSLNESGQPSTFFEQAYSLWTNDISIKSKTQANDEPKSNFKTSFYEEEERRNLAVYVALMDYILMTEPMFESTQEFDQIYKLGLENLRQFSLKSNFEDLKKIAYDLHHELNPTSFTTDLGPKKFGRECSDYLPNR